MAWLHVQPIGLCAARGFLYSKWITGQELDPPGLGTRAATYVLDESLPFGISDAGKVKP